MTRPTGPDPLVVTVDLWHTLLTGDPGSRARVEAARTSAWMGPLRSAGLAGGEAEAAVRAMRAEAARLQSTGRSVPIARQARLLAAATGVEVPIGPVEATIGDALRSSRFRRAPGALRALDGLRRSGRRLAIVSNILAEPPGPIYEALKLEGLAERFDLVYLSCEHRFAKPSPAPFRSVLAALRARPAEAVHIGDHSDDVVGALSAGVPVLRFTGLLDSYPAEAPEQLRRIPRGLPGFARWSDLLPEWPRLLRGARAVLDRSRGRRGRAPRA